MRLYDALTDPFVSMEVKSQILEDRMREIDEEIDEFKARQDEWIESLGQE